MSHSNSSCGVRWISRKFKKFPGAEPIKYLPGLEGNPLAIINPILWEDDNMKEGKNWNVVTDNGRTLIFNTIFAFTGSGSPVFMCFGASSTAANHLDTRLTHELIADGTRPHVTNENGNPFSSSTVTTTSYQDTDYDPPYDYYVQAIARGDLDGDTSLNVGQPIREVGLNTNVNCPGSPTGTSGILFNHYVYSSTTTLDPGTLFIALAFLHL